MSLAMPPRVDKWRTTVSEIAAVGRSLAIAGDAMEAWMAGFRST
jgi:hypothetical protein